jgi:hypothetical protein
LNESNNLFDKARYRIKTPITVYTNDSIYADFSEYLPEFINSNKDDVLDYFSVI